MIVDVTCAILDKDCFLYNSTVTMAPMVCEAGDCFKFKIVQLCGFIKTSFLLDMIIVFYALISMAKYVDVSSSHFFCMFYSVYKYSKQ